MLYSNKMSGLNLKLDGIRQLAYLTHVITSEVGEILLESENFAYVY